VIEVSTILPRYETYPQGAKLSTGEIVTYRKNLKKLSFVAQTYLFTREKSLYK
jgi:hypothetical protein